MWLQRRPYAACLSTIRCPLHSLCCILFPYSSESLNQGFLSQAAKTKLVPGLHGQVTYFGVNTKLVPGLH